MKNLNKILYRYSLVILAVSTLISCESEFEKGDTSPNTNPPSVANISEAREDVVVTQGVVEGNYIIRGENLSSMVSIHFNGVAAGFNPALITDNVAFTKVPIDAPFVNAGNILRLETLGGVLEIDFPLLNIVDFTEGIVDGAKVVTLNGGDFTDASKVTFVSGSEAAGNLVEREAEILSISPTQVVAAVPPGVTQAFIFLETSRGAIAQSASYGFSLSVYIDALAEGWATSEWGGTHELASSEQALGDFSIKSIREAWSGLTFLPEDVEIGFTDYQSITVQIFGAGDIVSVNLALNDFDAQVQLPLTPGEWTKFVIPLSDFYPSGGAPEEIFRIDLQESSNTGEAQYIFYVDDFGFL